MSSVLVLSQRAQCSIRRIVVEEQYLSLTEETGVRWCEQITSVMYELLQAALHKLHDVMSVNVHCTAPLPAAAAALLAAIRMQLQVALSPSW
jgi:hypothetical protein